MGLRFSLEDFVALGSCPCLIREKEKNTIFIFAIEFKCILLLITVQPQNGLD